MKLTTYTFLYRIAISKHKFFTAMYLTDQITYVITGAHYWLITKDSAELPVD